MSDSFFTDDDPTVELELVIDGESRRPGKKVKPERVTSWIAMEADIFTQLKDDAGQLVKLIKARKWKRALRAARALLALIKKMSKEAIAAKIVSGN